MAGWQEDKLERCFLSFFRPCLLAYLPASLLACLLATLPARLPACHLGCSPTCLLTCMTRTSNQQAGSGSTPIRLAMLAQPTIPSASPRTKAHAHCPLQFQQKHARSPMIRDRQIALNEAIL